MTEKKAKKAGKLSLFQRVKRDQTTGARRAVLDDLFNDMYSNRWQIYKINLIRGLFFGLGSVLGGTLLIALLVWILSQVGAVVPFLSDFIQQILDTLGNRGNAT